MAAVRALCRSLHTLSLRTHQVCLEQMILTSLRMHTVHSHGSLPPSIKHICAANIHASAAREKFVPWKNTPAYTTKALGLKQSAGRNITGRITVHGRGSGHKRRYRMVDFKRSGPAQGDVAEEKVLYVRYDPCRTANIAMVAGGTHKRWILATVNMEAGDVIKTSSTIGRMTVSANEGDAYPLGALPIGCLVHNLELYEGAGGTLARAAGTSVQLIRKTGGQVILKLPSKQQISVSENCMATVGRVSNEEHNKRIIGKAGRNRWLGKRPSSGLFQRKGGWAGRKIRPPPPIKVYTSNTNATHIDV